MKAKTEIAKTVDEYIAGFEPAIQQRLEQMRETIKKASPEATELISYGMPAYALYGALVFFAAFKKHIGFYAMPTGHAAFEKELSVYKQGKGSVQFPLNEQMPLKLVSKIVKFRTKQNLEKMKIEKK